MIDAKADESSSTSSESPKTSLLPPLLEEEEEETTPQLRAKEDDSCSATATSAFASSTIAAKLSTAVLKHSTPPLARTRAAAGPFALLRNSFDSDCHPSSSNSLLNGSRLDGASVDALFRTDAIASAARFLASASLVLKAAACCSAAFLAALTIPLALASVGFN